MRGSFLQFPALDQRRHPAWVDDFGEVSDVLYQFIRLLCSCEMTSTVVFPPENNVSCHRARGPPVRYVQDIYILLDFLKRVKGQTTNRRGK